MRPRGYPIGILPPGEPVLDPFAGSGTTCVSRLSCVRCCIIKCMKGEGYVSQRDGGYWVRDTRVSLDSIVYGFLNGQTAESIAQSFPLLALEQVYGAIAFYLAHRAEIDAYLHEGRLDYERLMEANRRADPAFYQKLIDARQRQP